MSDMMFHDHNECMRQYFAGEKKTQARMEAGKAKNLVNYARQTDMPFGNTKVVLSLCAITAGILMYAGALAGL
jgi:hypothetical protein